MFGSGFGFERMRSCVFGSRALVIPVAVGSGYKIRCRLLACVEYSSHFDLKHMINSSARVQPETSLNFKENNEPPLVQINDTSCVI